MKGGSPLMPRAGQTGVAINKCPQGELNPCFHLERVASLPLDHGGGIAGWLASPSGWKVI